MRSRKFQEVSLQQPRHVAFAQAINIQSPYIIDHANLMIKLHTAYEGLVLSDLLPDPELLLSQILLHTPPPENIYASRRVLIRSHGAYYIMILNYWWPGMGATGDMMLIRKVVQPSSLEDIVARCLGGDIGQNMQTVLVSRLRHAGDDP